MRPHVICHMMGSVDGGLRPSRYTLSPDGASDDWSRAYEAAHAALESDAWMVGRVTMAEMSRADAHLPPTGEVEVERPVHVARQADSYAVAVDHSGKLHFEVGGEVGGDAAVVLLGRDVADAHLAELAADGVSYIVAEDADMALGPLLEVLGERFGVRRLLLEGGGEINGAMLAAGLVDELSVLVAPALDGGDAAGRIVSFADGLRGEVRLSLLSAEAVDHGLVYLRYEVTSGAAAANAS